MSRFCISSDPLSRRRWRSGHPFRPRLGRLRRAFMLAMLIVFSLVIGCYVYITDSERVRNQSEAYLSRLVGGRVIVRAATLSLFQGLRLEDVNVYVDEGNHPDSLLFTAQTFALKYDISKIIRGQIEATQIIAQKPRVLLMENVDTHEWNVQRLGKVRQPTAPMPMLGPGKPTPMPAIMLRDARVEIFEVRDKQPKSIGYEALNGNLMPSGGGGFTFDVQTRGLRGVGWWAHGQASLNPGVIDAELHDFDFRRDAHTMLWENVRDLLERHGVSMLIDVLRVHYETPHDKEKFRATMEATVRDTTVTVIPEEWLPPADVRRRKTLHDGVVTMRGFYQLAGYRPPLADANKGTGKHSDKGTQAQVQSRAGAPPVAPRPGAPAAPTTEPVVALASPCNRADDSVAGELASPGDALALMTESLPIRLCHGSGTFIFTESGFELKKVTGEVEGNRVVVDGRMDGYTPVAPFRVSIRSADQGRLALPPLPQYLNALPSELREVYTALRPDGACTLKMDIDRPIAGTRPHFSGAVDILDGAFRSVFFPYPLSQTRGRIAFNWDPVKQGDLVHIVGVRGRGKPDGPNRDTWIQIDGELGPLGVEFPDPHIELHIKGVGVSSEKAFMEALPPQVRQPLKIFDADKTGQFPRFHGDFGMTVLHRANAASQWSFDTDLNLDDSSGKLVGFPYPIEHMAAEVRIRNGGLEIVRADMKRGQTTLHVDGTVKWTETPPGAPPKEPDITSDIRLAIRDLPLDSDLLAALPPDAASWIRRVGVSGKLDVKGHVFQGQPDPARPGMPVVPNDVRYDLAIGLHDGTLWPEDGTFSASNVAGRMRLTRDALEIYSMHAERGLAELSLDGAVAWSDGPPQLGMHIKAKNLQADSPLYSLLPLEARMAWSDIQPHGALDADLTVRQTFAPDEMPTPGKSQATGGANQHLIGEEDTAAVGSVAAALGATPGRASGIILAPAHLLPASLAGMPFGFHAVVQPRGMICTLACLPYQLENVRGTLTITPEKVTLEDIEATHGSATLSASGFGSFGPHPAWNLKLNMRDLPVNEELRRALPAALVTVLDSIKLRGNIDVDIPKFASRIGVIAPDAPPVSPASVSAVTAPSTAVDLDMADSVITFHNCQLEAGVPIRDMDGKLKLKAAVRGGKISDMEGTMSLPSVNIAGRNLTDVNLNIRKPQDRQEISLENMHGTLAGGQAAGEVRLYYPDDGPAKYMLSAVVRNADLETLVKDPEKAMRGELTASMSLSGSWDGSGVRRGRGDVIVTGKELYHLPLLVGLFQVTNMALPIATPFKSGAARYSVEGQRVNFEHVDLRSENMMMQGSGYLDFRTKQVRMTFTTDNPNGLKVPFINELMNGARGELMKITIKGTIKEPKMEANSFGTISTTIDEVFKGDGKKGK